MCAVGATPSRKNGRARQRGSERFADSPSHFSRQARQRPGTRIAQIHEPRDTRAAHGA